MKNQRNRPEQPAGRSSRLKNVLVILLIVAAILLIALFFAIHSLAGQTANANTPTAPVSSIPPTRMVVIPAIATVTPTATLPTAAPGVVNGIEPPPCTFPLAQITTTASAPANYAFSDPRVVLTALRGNYYSIVQWLPDNQQVLMAEAKYSAVEKMGSGPAKESIDLFNPRTVKLKVYALRNAHFDPPAWQASLNAVVYPAFNYLGRDPNTHQLKFTRQVWVSYGDPNTAQMLADNLPQFPVAVKPDGSGMVYLSDNQISRRDASMQALPSVSFDPTQWDYDKSSRNGIPDHYAMAWQPGTSLIFFYSDGVSDNSSGYTFILDSDTGRVCKLNLGGWALKAHWSSDGQYLGIVRATKYSLPIHSSDLTVLDTTTGKLYTLGIIPQDMEGDHFVSDLAWAPDNRHLIVVANDRLYLAEFASGQSVNVLPQYNWFFSSRLAWSPDGSKLVICCPANSTDRVCFIPVQKTGE